MSNLDACPHCGDLLTSKSTYYNKHYKGYCLEWKLRKKDLKKLSNVPSIIGRQVNLQEGAIGFDVETGAQYLQQDENDEAQPHVLEGVESEENSNNRFLQDSCISETEIFLNNDSDDGNDSDDDECGNGNDDDDEDGLISSEMFVDSEIESLDNDSDVIEIWDKEIETHEDENRP